MQNKEQKELKQEIQREKTKNSSKEKKNRNREFREGKSLIFIWSSKTPLYLEKHGMNIKTLTRRNI